MENNLGLFNAMFKNIGNNAVKHKEIRCGDYIKITSKRFQNYVKGNYFKVYGFKYSGDRVTHVKIRPSYENGRSSGWFEPHLRTISINGVIKVLDSEILSNSYTIKNPSMNIRMKYPVLFNSYGNVNFRAYELNNTLIKEVNRFVRLEYNKICKLISK